MSSYVLLGLFVLSTGVVTIVAYAVKRYFDDKTAARAFNEKLASESLAVLVKTAAELEQDRVFVRERFDTFGKALANGIAQSVQLVAESRDGYDQKQAKVVSALIRGQRKPAP